MFRITFFLIFLFGATVAAYPQQKKTIYYDYADRVSRKSEAFYYLVLTVDEHDRPIGKAYGYWEDGKKKFEGQLLSINPIVYDGLCKFYSIEGNLKSKSVFKNGKEEGTSYDFYRNGKKRKIRTMRAGKEEGSYTEFFETGKIKEEFVYNKSGEKGKFSSFYPDGSLWEKGVFINGKKDGEWKSFHSNHKQAERIFYTSGRYKDTSYFYDKEGTITFKVVAENSELLGKFSSYRSNGTIERKGVYRDGKWQDKLIFYSIEGQISKIYQFKSGILEKFTEFFPDGVIRKESVFSDSNSHISNVWNKEKILISEVVVLNDTLSSSRDYDDVGNLVAEKFGKGLFPEVAKDKKTCLYGVRNASGQWIISPEYTLHSEHGLFNIVSKEEKFGVLDRLGNFIVPPVYDDISVLYETEFEIKEPRKIISDSFLIKDGNYNFKYQVKYPLNYYFPLEGFFRVAKDSKVGVVNKYNKMIVPLEYDSIGKFANGFMITRKKGLYGFADTSGFFFPPVFGALSDFKASGYAIFRNTISEKKSGAIDTSGNIIIPCEYDWVDYNFRERRNLIWTKKGKKLFVFTLKGERLTDKGYDMLPTVSAGETPKFNTDSILIIKQDGLYGILGYDGTPLFPFEYDTIQIIQDWYRLSDPLNGAIAVMRKNGKWFTATRKGKSEWPEYEYLYAFRCSKDLTGRVSQTFLLAKKDGKYGIVRDDKSIVIPFDYDLGYYTNGNSDNITLIRNKVMSIYSMHQLTKLKASSKQHGIKVFCLPINQFPGRKFNCGIMSFDRKILVQPEFQIVQTEHHTSRTENNYIILENEKGRVIIRKDGQPIIAPGMFATIGEISGDYAVVLTFSGKVGVYDLKNKNFLIKPLFDAVAAIKESSSAWWLKKEVIRNPDTTKSKDEDFLAGGWELRNSKGKTLLPPEYDFPVFFRGSTGVVFKNGLSGVLRIDGKLLLPAVYEKIIHRENNLFMIMSGEKWGFFNSSTQLLVEPQWDDITSFDYGYALFNSGGKFGIVDPLGRILVKGETDDFSNTNAQLLYEYFPQFPGSHDIYRLGEHFQNYPDITRENKMAGKLLARAAKYSRYASEKSKTRFPYRPKDSDDFPEFNLYQYAFICHAGNKTAPPNPFILDEKHYRMKLIGVNDYSFVFEEEIDFSFTDSLTGKSGFESKKQHFNYLVSKDGTLFPIKLSDLVDSTVSYREIIYSKLEESLLSSTFGEKLNCTYYEQLINESIENFTLSESGITFYIQVNSLTVFPITYNFIELSGVFDRSKPIWKMLH